MICFTSDQHFYHENIIKSVGRPFANAEEMNRVLIRNWNERVCTEDEVYIPESEQQKMEDANFQIYLAEFLAQYPLLTTNMNANMLHRELFENM